MLYWDYLDAALPENKQLNRRLRHSRRCFDNFCENREDRLHKRALSNCALHKQVRRPSAVRKRSLSTPDLRTLHGPEFHLPTLVSTPIASQWSQCMPENMSNTHRIFSYRADDEDRTLMGRAANMSKTAPAVMSNFALPTYRGIDFNEASYRKPHRASRANMGKQLDSHPDTLS